MFLSQLLPYPLDSGVKVRTYYMLRRLALHHEVTLVCFVRPDNTQAQVDHLRELCASVHTVLMRRSTLTDARFLAQSLVQGRSFILSRDTAASMHQTIDLLLERAAREARHFEAVHCDQLWMAQYALRVQGARRVIDQHNAVYMIPKRMAAHERNPIKRVLLEREWRVMARSETQICRQFDRVITVTEQDRDALESLSQGPMAPVSVIPICVDTGLSRFVGGALASEGILHLGTMYWPPNVEGVLWFANHVMPLVRERVPHSRLIVVGKRPPKSISKLHERSGVEVVGYVEDPRPAVARSRVFIVPLRAGGGMRVKILDAWTWGIPVVSTSIGAEGIAAHPGQDILIADSPEDFSSAVVRLIRDDVLWDRMAAAGRAWVAERYDWRNGYKALDLVYDQLQDKD